MVLPLLVQDHAQALEHRLRAVRVTWGARGDADTVELVGRQRVDGLPHLVLATDAWLGRSILEIDQPFHPLGQAGPGAEEDGLDLSIFSTVTPSYADVLEVRTSRVAMVRDFLATVTSDELARTRRNPWAPENPETTRSCLHVILEEEWEHHRYAVRDLDALERAPGA